MGVGFADGLGGLRLGGGVDAQALGLGPGVQAHLLGVGLGGDLDPVGTGQGGQLDLLGLSLGLGDAGVAFGLRQRDLLVGLGVGGLAHQRLKPLLLPLGLEFGHLGLLDHDFLLG